ncbi:MAG: hypothetical protein XD85_0079 [Parcubacteria bacterium 34_609]|nr:MAG: hypothetical protein XD85_0079 [Parcubacteria bacterium 34_609]KUK99334.1 MAG: hypothetical protein XE08_0096 [Parcubacteria bacterium 32_520]
MELYNPESFNLPPLLIVKRTSRKNMENDIKVKNFIDTHLLLDNNFHKLFLDILEKSDEILKVSREEPSYKDFGLQKIFDYLSSKDMKKINTDKENTKTKLPLEREFILYFVNNFMKRINSNSDTESLIKILNPLFLETKKKLLSLSEKIENAICEYEEKNKKVRLDILSSTNFYFCNKCNKIVSKMKFTPKKCLCGEEIDKLSKVDKKSISHFNENLLNFINSNYWLEFGVGHLLKQNNFRILIGYDVLGNSGVCHEIDNIVYCPNENFRFFCECKNTDVKENDVFIFSGKMLDIGGTRGYIFTTAENTSENIKRLARSKNINIIENVLNKDPKDLICEIKE